MDQEIQLPHMPPHNTRGAYFESFVNELQTTSKFDLLKNWVPDCSAQDKISAKSF